MAKRKAQEVVPPELAAVTEGDKGPQAEEAEPGISGTFGLTPLPAVETTPYPTPLSETPEQKSDATWFAGERQRKHDEERRDRRTAEINERAAGTAQAAKLRRDVYASRGYPDEGDAGAEAEVRHRLELAGIEEPGYEDVMALAMTEAGVTLPLDGMTPDAAVDETA